MVLKLVLIFLMRNILVFYFILIWGWNITWSGLMIIFSSSGRSTSVMFFKQDVSIVQGSQWNLKDSCILDESSSLLSALM